MAVTIGLTGLVTSWTGTLNAGLLVQNSFSECTLDITCQDIDTTALAASLASMTYIPGLYESKGTLKGRSNKPAGGTLGNTGVVAWGSGGYSLNVVGWELMARCKPIETTNLTTGASAALTYTPGIYDWEITYDAIIDDSTALVLPGTAAATITVTSHTVSAVAQTYTGSGFPVQVGAAVRYGDRNMAKFRIRGSGALTTTGTSNSLTATPAALVTPTAGTLRLQAASSRTYDVSAFWTEIRLGCPINGLFTTDISFQGSGAVTIG